MIAAGFRVGRWLSGAILIEEIKGKARSSTTGDGLRPESPE